MARISEFEFSGGDTVEIALTTAEYNAMVAADVAGNPIEYSIQQYELVGSDAAGWGLDANQLGDAESNITFDVNSTWTFDTDSGEWVAGDAFAASFDGPTNFSPAATGNASNGFDSLGLYSSQGGTDTPIQMMSISEDGEPAGVVTIETGGPMDGLADSAIEYYDWDDLAQPTGGFNNLAWNQPDITNPVWETGTGFGTDSGVCFTTGTLIETNQGEKRVENLVAGDQVQTLDHGLQVIKWIGSSVHSAAQIAKSPKLRPILIKAGALGQNTPVTDLIVSPQHRVLINSKIAERMFGNREALVSAKSLLPLNGIEILDDQRSVTYFHLMCAQHEIVMSNGAWTETLYAGKEALKSIAPEAREELFTLMPELRDFTDIAMAESARLIPDSSPRKKLVERHLKNNKSIFEETLH